MCLPAEAATHTHTKSARSAFNLAAQHQPFSQRCCPPQATDRLGRKQGVTQPHVRLTWKQGVPLMRHSSLELCSRAGKFPPIASWLTCPVTQAVAMEMSSASRCVCVCFSVVHTCCRSRRGRGTVIADAAPHQKQPKKHQKPHVRWSGRRFDHLLCLRMLCDAGKVVAKSTSSDSLGTLGAGCFHLELISKV